MNLKEQVTSLELSKKLKELGVKQSSLFAYTTGKDPILLCEMRKGMWLDEDGWPNTTLGEEDLISAFSVAELGEMLPKNIQGRLGMMFLEIYPNAVQNTWYCGYQRVDDAIREEADSEANARAKLLINLLQNKLIEL